MSATEKPAQDSSVLERLQRLLRRAEQGDESSLPELRAALAVNEWAIKDYGDLGRQAQEAWLQLIAGPNLLLRESVARKAEELRRELAGPDPTPLERLLVDRVVASWIQTYYADAVYAQLKAATPAQHTAALRRQSGAQQRYLQAIKTLATTRKLLRPGPSSPVEVAMRLNGGGRAPAGRREHAPSAGVGVEN
jgi:hypothetical protein